MAHRFGRQRVLFCALIGSSSGIKRKGAPLPLGEGREAGFYAASPVG
jgi:hypothetical protein